MLVIAAMFSEVVRASRSVLASSESIPESALRENIRLYIIWARSHFMLRRSRASTGSRFAGGCREYISDLVSFHMIQVPLSGEALVLDRTLDIAAFSPLPSPHECSRAQRWSGRAWRKASISCWRTCGIWRKSARAVCPSLRAWAYCCCAAATAARPACA